VTSPGRRGSRGRGARGSFGARVALAGLLLVSALALAPATARAQPRGGTRAEAGRAPHDPAARPSETGTRAPARGDGRVLLVHLEGPVSPVTDEALGAAIDRAERERYRALIIQVDTPGGLESSMRQMVKRMLASEVPILTWVAPGGARAASAGVFITMAGDVAAMAPGTNIGAATPVSLQGPMDSTMAHKVTNDAAAFARTIAAQRGRNAQWAEQAVRLAVAVSETEAESLAVVDFIAATRVELLARADGRTWRRGAETHTLEVKGLPVDEIEPGLRQRLLAVIAEPNVAYILMLLGFYGLMFELQNPGAVLPGVVGGIALILAFLALSTLPVNYAGIALILLSIAFFVAEIKVASHGVLAAGGVIALLLGSIILFRGETARLSWQVIVGATAATSLFFLFIIGAGLRAQRLKVQTGGSGLVGLGGRAVERLAPAGRVEVSGELWNAVSDSPVEAGAEVVVTGLSRLTLRVRPVAKEGRS
jgi:membrane-bound serine protease (ClpP class)